MAEAPVMSTQRTWKIRISMEPYLYAPIVVMRRTNEGNNEQEGDDTPRDITELNPIDGDGR